MSPAAPAGDPGRGAARVGAERGRHHHAQLDVPVSRGLADQVGLAGDGVRAPLAELLGDLSFGKGARQDADGVGVPRRDPAHAPAPGADDDPRPARGPREDRQAVDAVVVAREGRLPAGEEAPQDRQRLLQPPDPPAGRVERHPRGLVLLAHHTRDHAAGPGRSAGGNPTASRPDGLDRWRGEWLDSPSARRKGVTDCPVPPVTSRLRRDRAFCNPRPQPTRRASSRPGQSPTVNSATASKPLRR